MRGEGIGSRPVTPLMISSHRVKTRLTTDETDTAAIGMVSCTSRHGEGG
jgi:hypothetical protein